MLSGSRNIIRIVSRQNNGARLLAASQQHRTSQPGTGARLHTQPNINNNKVSRTCIPHYSYLVDGTISYIV